MARVYHTIAIAIIHLRLASALVSHGRAAATYSTASCRLHCTTASSGNTGEVEEVLLQKLGLTPTQAASILKRQPTTASNRATAVVDWLTAQGRFTLDQAAAIVTGHPPVLNYGIETNLAPTVGFYQGALLDDETGTTLADGNDGRIEPRVAEFLCESPGLLEYNVKKRLAPRLERVAQLEGRTGVLMGEDTLRAVATKTDSRFDEWLRLLEFDGKNEIDGRDDLLSDKSDDDEDAVHAIKRTPSSFVVVSNLQSGGNIGNILRSASIFGCEECVVVGQKRHRLTGDHGSRFDLRRRHVWSHTEARDYLHERGVRIYGVEIMADASPIMKYDPETGVVRFPFDRKWQGAAFVMGNEGVGLSERQREICDEFLYIPQTRGGRSDGGGGGSASLNVACAATVVLQAYCLWANYPVAGMEGEKFVALSGEDEQLRHRER